MSWSRLILLFIVAMLAALHALSGAGPAADGPGAMAPPLTLTPSWTAEGNVAGAGFGDSVAAADVNGDGFDDAIVAAFQYDNGQDNEGRAFLFLGSASGLSTSPSWITESNQAFAEYGKKVASAGDVNGDGYEDVLVGADVLDVDQINEGRAYLYMGSASGLSTVPAWTADGDQTGAAFGFSLSSAGDVNGDGYDDVLVGAFRHDGVGTDSGRASVYLGSASGLTTSPAWTVLGDQERGEFGVSVGTAGDVNNDGFSDVIIGANHYSNGQQEEGRAYVYMGSASGLSTSPAWITESNQAFAEYGFGAAETAGDVNGDGFDDVIVAARFFSNGQSAEGRAFVYHGSSSGLSTSPAWTAESNQSGAEYGRGLGTAGDINGDGFDDVIVAASLFGASFTNEGRAFVYLGSASGLSPAPAWTFDGGQTGAMIIGVGSAGDTNGDGLGDVLVGAFRFSNGQSGEGKAFLFRGILGCRDSDGDGYGSPGNAECPAGASEDCDDNNPRISPREPEIYDGIDNNCNAAADEGLDDDADGIPNFRDDCSSPSPGAGVGPDGCTVCEAEPDSDGDGFGASVDCNDVDAAVHPGAAEACNLRDDDCDGLSDEGLDLDGDGYTPCSGDCNDANIDIRPGAVELPGNAADENCDGALLCDPSAPWPSPGVYVSCVATECDALVAAGMLTEEDCEALTNAAGRSRRR